jgi:beta-glucanase (GH16 family)
VATRLFRVAALVLSGVVVLVAPSLAAGASKRPPPPRGTSPGGGGGASTGSSGAGGAPTISLPPAFSPIASYTSLVKDYEFDGPRLPTGWTAGNDTTNGFDATIWQASQVSMTGSSVALTASNKPSDGYPYKSGWISTAGAFSFTHGLIDFRAKMPAGQGLWSGLWAVNPPGTSPLTEIDVQEMLLGNTHTVFGGLHNWGPTPAWSVTQSTAESADLSTGFHDYQVEWQPGLLTWAVDGVAYAQYSEAQATAADEAWPFDAGNGVYLIADLAVAGASDWGGPPNASTVFPATMQIQSVKIWQ